MTRSQSEVVVLGKSDVHVRLGRGNGGARESVPNSLTPPAGYEPAPTRRQLLALAVQAELRRRAGITPSGHMLGDAAVRLIGRPCPLGYGTENGYNKHGCRCEHCRAAHRVARLERHRRRTARSTPDAHERA